MKAGRIFYGILFAAFLGPLLILKQTFLHGDYRVQFYPWSFYTSKILKTAGHLPYWTDQIACGFPLVAEGQIAAYSIIQGLLYSLLPFVAAYTWNIPLHVLLGGAGFYLYAKKIGMDEDAAAFSAIVFSFSSAYGGCFYTTGTLRVLAWLPWGLWSLEKFRGWARILICGMFFSQLWTGGFPQLAAYAYLYVLLLSVLDKRDDPRALLETAAGMGVAVLLALPQIFLTLELAGVSVRQGETLSFALWGSVAPPGILSLLFPSWGSVLRLSFYIGLLPLFLVFIHFASKRSSSERSHAWLALFFFLLALGQFNPLYAWLIQKMSFTGFRNPSKFLFFCVFSLAVLAGSGLQKYLQGQFSEVRFRRIVLGALGAVLLLPVVLPFVLDFGQEFLQAFGRRYAEMAYSQKTDPLKNAAEYTQMFMEFLEDLRYRVSYADPWNWVAAGAAALSAFLLVASGRMFRDKKTRIVCIFILTSADLFVFGRSFGTGFIGNARELKRTDPTAAIAGQLGLAPEEKLVEWVGTGNLEWFEPSSNMLYGIAHPGAYSPLLIKRYYELCKDLGFVDASLGRRPYSMETWKRQKGVLDAVGANVVLSDQAMSLEGLEFSGKIADRYVYRNKNALPAVHAATDWRVIKDKEERLAYLKNDGWDPAQEAVIEEDVALDKSASSAPEDIRLTYAHERWNEWDVRVQAEKDAILVFQSVFYPRWKMRVDGHPEPVIAIDHAFSGIPLKKGEHRVRFFYDESAQRAVEWIALTAWGMVLVGAAATWLNRPKA